MVTEELGEIGVNKFKVGEISNDFSDSGIKNALAENGIGYKETFSDIGIMQKLSTRTETEKPITIPVHTAETLPALSRVKTLLPGNTLRNPTRVPTVPKTDLKTQPNGKMPFTLSAIRFTTL